MRALRRQSTPVYVCYYCRTYAVPEWGPDPSFARCGRGRGMVGQDGPFHARVLLSNLIVNR